MCRVFLPGDSLTAGRPSRGRGRVSLAVDGVHLNGRGAGLYAGTAMAAAGTAIRRVALDRVSRR